MRLWIDDRCEAPAGWRRVRSLAELDRALRGGATEAALGGSDAFVDGAAQRIEQGAFAGRVRPLRVELRLPNGPLRDVAGRALANAAAHWAAMPPAPPPARRPAGNLLLRFLAWHLLGFAAAVGGFEFWHLWRHGSHAPIVAWFIPDRPAAKR